MEKLLQDIHETMITELIPKGLITISVPCISEPVSLYIEAYRLPVVLQELLSNQNVTVHSEITIPTYINDTVEMLSYSHGDILDGNFKIQT